MAEAGAEATVGLSLWSAAVGMSDKHFETRADRIDTSYRVAARFPASDPNGQTSL